MKYLSELYITEILGIDDLAHSAASSPHNDLPEPTEAQKHAGNYKMGHLNFQGLPISIENPKGSYRSGKDKDGNEWKTLMTAHYGFIDGYKSIDGDAIDCFIGPDHKSELVYIVNQSKKEDNLFDEHKVLFCYSSFKKALEGYLSNYEKEWDNIKSIHKSNISDFKDWLKNKNTRKPFNESFLCIYLPRS